ncbi:MAG TPA: hypothetical protein VMH36_13845 [Alphaproteobacteria bacterium]|nr:hypothetical protein [Alphaproteobacteria bacterium]
MKWIEYVRVLSQFRARFGQLPPSMLTEDGALDHMQAALDRSADGDAADDRQRRPRTAVPRPKPDA